MRRTPSELQKLGLSINQDGVARSAIDLLAYPDVHVARLAAMEPAALAGRVTIGHLATTTRGNAAEIAAWARAEQLGSLRIVTAGYHMPRALLELRRALPEVALLPHPMLPATLRDSGAAGRLRTWSLLLREYLKYLAVWAGLTGPAARPPDTRS